MPHVTFGERLSTSDGTYPGAALANRVDDGFLLMPEDDCFWLKGRKNLRASLDGKMNELAVLSAKLLDLNLSTHYG